MPISLLDSQFATLEEPTPDERPIIADVNGQPDAVAGAILRQLDGRQAGNESASSAQATRSASMGKRR
jgi:hypothetical protein